MNPALVSTLFLTLCSPGPGPGTARGPGAADQTDGAWIRLGSDPMTDRRQTRFLTPSSDSASTSGTVLWRGNLLSFRFFFFFEDYICVCQTFLCVKWVSEIIRPDESHLEKLLIVWVFAAWFPLQAQTPFFIVWNVNNIQYRASCS